jgi:hypothetical protein
LFWRDAAKPWLSSTFTTGIGPHHRTPTPEEIRRIDLEERAQTWAHLLHPLIEGMVRCGSEGEVPALLASLDPSWQPLDLGRRLTDLAGSVERPDLAARWVAQVSALPAPIRSPGVMGQEFHLLYQHQAPTFGAWSYTRTFRQQGIGVALLHLPEGGNPDPAWPEQAPRWAMLNPGGEVILQGRILPDPGALIRTFGEAHVPTWTQDAERFRRDHPDNLASLAYLAGVYQGQAHAFWEERLPTRYPPPKPTAEMGDQERTCWRDYFQALQSLMEDPLGTHPSLLQKAAPYALVVHWDGLDDLQTLPGEDRSRLREQSRRELPKDLGLEGLATRLLPRLEAELVRRPSAAALWDSWIALAAVVGRSPNDLVSSIEPSPEAIPGSWPNARVLLRLCQDQKRWERWGEVLDLLGPFWKTEQARKASAIEVGRSPQGVSFEGWNGRLTHILLEACLHLGDLPEAEKIIGALASGGASADDVEDLQPLASVLGHGEWARKWLKK